MEAKPSTAPPASAPPPPVSKRAQVYWALGALAGAAATLLLMSIDAQVPRAPLWGMLGTAVSAVCVLGLCGLLRATEDAASLPPALFDPKPDEPSWLAPRITLPSAMAALCVGGLAGGVAGLPIAITLALAILGASALRRPALFLFVAASLPILPMLGNFGLWDPWETHYGEVAREILARSDWITLWWAQDEWFRSKPILIFWMEALSWGALGIPFEADSNPAHPEWAIRLPHYLLAMGALFACYAALKRSFSTRAALISALVLATTPYFFFLSHQAITDMPFVSTMTIAMALLTLALHADDGETVAQYRLGPVLITAQSALLFCVVMVALPQALYLISRNITFVAEESGFWLHPDQFLFGSAGNSDVPGNPVHRLRGPYLRAAWFQPWVQGALWLLGLGFVVQTLRKQRRVTDVAMYGFYLFCSLAWMAKGIPGFALPGLIAALYLITSGRMSLLTSGKLHIARGVLLLAVTGLPWYVAMYGRLGPFFTDRLLIHDHINRLAQGVHGDTGTIQYFLWQLGYGAFPWIGLMPLGFVIFRQVRGRSPEETRRMQQAALLIALWALTSFTLFSAMITKFHHYIFPAVPPLALLTGLLLDRVLGDDSQESRAFGLRPVFVIVLSALLAVLGVAGLYGDVRGVAPEDVDAAELSTWVQTHPWNTSLCVLLLGLAAVGLFYGARQLDRTRAETSATSVLLGPGLFGAAVLAAFVGRDLSWTTGERPAGHERLIQLFIYKYERPFPDHLDYRPVLAGFALVVTALLLLASLTHLRKTATFALLGTAFWFASWSLNVYMIDLSPHWGQRELVKRYYDDRNSEDEPLVAWQMNWKGENLYSGNRVHVFVKLDNKDVKAWMDEHAGQRAYFLLEHTRLNNFRRMMGRRRYEELTTLRDNNKFVLVRAQI